MFPVPTLVGVNPHFGWANHPSFYIRTDEYPKYKDKTYIVDRGYYWYQDAESGWTDFLAHGGQLSFDGNKWRTENGGGFAGRSFTLNVKGYRDPIVLVGPWSSGCYALNEYLPKSATEVTLVVDRSYISAYITIDKANELLKGTDWEITLDKFKPIFLYQHKQKEQLSQSLQEKLQKEFDNALKGPTERMQFPMPR